MITTVVFDMDDTLFDEIDYCQSGFLAVAGAFADRLGVKDTDVLFNLLWVQFTSGNRKKCFNSVLDQLEINYNQQMVEEMIDIYRTHKPQISLPEQSAEILEKLKNKYTMALITDGFMPAQKLKVEALGIEKYFQCIVYTELIGREFWKPSPAGFEKILQALKTDAKNCAYIGDNEKKDFISPNRLGFETIQLIRPKRLHTKTLDQADAKPKHIIKSLDLLPDLICSL